MYLSALTSVSRERVHYRPRWFSCIAVSWIAVWERPLKLKCFWRMRSMR